MRFSTRSGTSREAGTDRGDERAVVIDLVHRRDVDARDRRELSQHAFAGSTAGALPRRDDLGDLADRFLAVADHERVDEIGHRLGIERAVPTGHDDRVLGATVLGPNRDAGQIEALEHVRVHELGGEPERHQVEAAGVVVGVDREEWHRGAPHLGRHVQPGRVGAFGERIVAFVEDLVQDLEPLVGQADLVGVGIDEEPGGEIGPMLRPEAPPLHPDVPSGLLDLGQEGFHPWPEV